MNNISALDWCNKDWTFDNDFALSRVTQEFPRLAKSQLSHFDGPQLWGKQEPRFIELIHNHPEVTKAALKTGVWHVSHTPNTDHLDCCGAPPILSPFRVTFKREYRFLMWRTMFVRLKTIENM